MKKVEIRNKVHIPLAIGESHFYSFTHLSDGREHLAVALGNWSKQEIVNVRIHSECLTGEIFGSSKCECGEQLNESLEKFNEEGGLILYLRQEGRGIGLYNKLDAYSLQNDGLDTVDANKAIGREVDERDYKVAAEMLEALGIKEVNLFSNNPLKKRGLELNNIRVRQISSTKVHIKKHNFEYLRTKVEKCGHKINLVYNQVGTSGQLPCGRLQA